MVVEAHASQALTPVSPSAWVVNNLTCSGLFVAPMMKDHQLLLRAALEANAHEPRAVSRIWVMLPFGYELDMLKMHLTMLVPHVDGFLITESRSHLQDAEPKPAYLTEMMATEGALPSAVKAKVHVRVVSREEASCSPYTRYDSSWCLEHYQREVLLDMLQSLASEDDIAILADTDEIASPHAIDLLRRCYPFQRRLVPSEDPNLPRFEPGMLRLIATRYVYSFKCLDRARWDPGPRAYSVRWLKANALNGTYLTNTRIRGAYSVAGLPEAAWHLASFGGATATSHRLRSWGHANLFDESSRRTDILQRCIAHCRQLLYDDLRDQRPTFCKEDAPSYQVVEAQSSLTLSDFAGAPRSMHTYTHTSGG